MENRVEFDAGREFERDGIAAHLRSMMDEYEDDHDTVFVLEAALMVVEERLWDA